jgi:hypothetical protein
MTATRDRIYQTSDLTGSARREFVDDARHGQAQLRTPEGESLVMLRSASLNHLAEMRDYAVAYLMLDNALSRPRSDRRPADFGEWAFIEVFDEDDLVTFRHEMNGVLMRAAAGEDTSVIESTLSDWRRSARTLADPVARSILSGEATHPSDWVDVERPTED